MPEASAPEAAGSVSVQAVSPPAVVVFLLRACRWGEHCPVQAADPVQQVPCRAPDRFRVQDLSPAHQGPGDPAILALALAALGLRVAVIREPVALPEVFPAALQAVALAVVL